MSLLCSRIPADGALVGHAKERPAAGDEPRIAGVPLSGLANLDGILEEVHEEIRAYLFLFVEVACVGHTAASCSRLHVAVWSSEAFWRAYGGPCVAAEPPGTQAVALREAFRKWLFHLDGAWADDFRQFVEEARASEFGADFTQLLADARYIVSGLTATDGHRPVEQFAEILRELLGEYDPTQIDERSAAEGLAAQVERRTDVFTEAQSREIIAVYERSVERAILDRNIEDSASEPDPFLDPLEGTGTGDDGWDTWGIPEGLPPARD